MWIWWYLRAIQHQRYSGSGGDAKIDEDVKVVNKESDPIGRLVANIKESKGELDLTPDEVMGAKVSISNNVFNIYNLMLRRNGAIDWLNGTALFLQVILLILTIQMITYISSSTNPRGSRGFARYL